MSDHEVAGRRYIVGRLNARQQFDITRRLGFMSLILEGDVTADHVDGARFIAGLAAGYLASVPQEDMDFILNTCLSVVTTVRDPSSSRAVQVMNRATGLMQFEDIDMPVMLELVDLVIQENLAPFFEKLRENRAAAASATEQP